jgi:hypothetical protein
MLRATKIEYLFLNKDLWIDDEGDSLNARRRGDYDLVWLSLNEIKNTASRTIMAASDHTKGLPVEEGAASAGHEVWMMYRVREDIGKPECDSRYYIATTRGYLDGYKLSYENPSDSQHFAYLKLRDNTLITSSGSDDAIKVRRECITNTSSRLWIEYDGPAPQVNREYFWHVGAFEDECDEGLTKREVSCRVRVGGRDPVPADDGLCDAGLKPVTHARCTTPSTYRWAEGQWGDCIKLEEEEKTTYDTDERVIAVQKRTVTCFEKEHGGPEREASASFCTGQQPDIWRPCVPQLQCPSEPEDLILVHSPRESEMRVFPKDIDQAWFSAMYDGEDGLEQQPRTHALVFVTKVPPETEGTKTLFVCDREHWGDPLVTIDAQYITIHQDRRNTTGKLRHGGQRNHEIGIVIFCDVGAEGKLLEAWLKVGGNVHGPLSFYNGNKTIGGSYFAELKILKDEEGNILVDEEGNKKQKGLSHQYMAIPCHRWYRSGKPLQDIKHLVTDRLEKLDLKV